ncbi:hypothetical protein [Nocardioides coralli]|uniref:hypothetical protein n=1 Tax=Nocardioides coralli TaxID=2872154 RepID=UPI001CA3B774|nr:hypothetical protein [Nocardioides coralli]QZY30101.1 hypothetical protein K6T13_05300 [Nocardioides coralli]
MPAPLLPRVRLRPGIRVAARGPGSLQVGAHHDQRLLLADTPDVRRLLALLRHGVDPGGLPPRDRSLCAELSEAGLLTSPDEDTVRERARAAAQVRLDCPAPVRPVLGRLLAAAGLPEAGPGRLGTVLLVVSWGAEPDRERLAESVRADVPHLLLTAVAGRLRLGPCVVPGLTACLRCVDEHLADVDPRHPLVVEQHRTPDAEDRVPTADLQLALAWAVRDLVSLVEGDRPATWSTTVELLRDGAVIRSWRRHPRCGCAWGDRLAG